MLRRKKTKIAALLLSFTLFLLLLLPVSPQDVGIYQGCGVTNRLTYHFFHANILHLVLNVWCFLSCVFLADASLSVIVTSFIIACTVPVFTPVPTVGFSGICFAILGFIMWQAKNKFSYNISIISCIALPLMLLPHAVNSLLHAYCYTTAVIIGMPFHISRSSHNSRSSQ